MSNAIIKRKRGVNCVKQPLIRPSTQLGGGMWPFVPGPGTISQAMALQTSFTMSEYWPSEKIQRFQLNQIQYLINHAVRHVPFYQTRRKEFQNLLLGQLTMEKFRTLPILSRTEILEAGDQMFAKVIPRNHGKIMDVSTSGSTGRLLKIKTTSLNGLFYQALSMRYHLWHKRDLSLSSMTIKTFPSNIKVQRVGNWGAGLPSGPAYLVNFTLPMPEILKSILELQPVYIQTHPGVLRELLRISKQPDQRPANLREVRLMGEPVSNDLRRMCMEQWGVPVANNYSAMELNIIALECPDNPGNLHVQSESLFVEVLDKNNKPCKPGEMGRCVVTPLRNFATPLFRYNNEDYLVAGESCSCGRGLPVITEVCGRERGLIQMPDGSRVMPQIALYRVMDQLPVLQHQLAQKSLTDIEIRIVTKEKMTEKQEQLIISTFYKDIGQPLNYHISYQDEIPRLPNGKFEVFRNEIEENSH